MGLRGPKPSKNPGESIGAHVDAATLAHLEEVTYTRKRSRSFVAAEAIRRGLPLVEKDFPALRPALKKHAEARARAAKAAKAEGAGKGKAAKSRVRAAE